MNEHQKQIITQCKQGAENNTMDFPEIVMTLIQAGFDRYIVDFCTSTATYYLPNGDCVTLDFQRIETSIPETVDVDAIKKAIYAAQTKAENYSYKWFCESVMNAGCTHYLVSFVGKRVVYFGRTGDVHVEHFPK